MITFTYLQDNAQTSYSLELGVLVILSVQQISEVKSNDHRLLFDDLCLLIKSQSLRDEGVDGLVVSFSLFVRVQVVIDCAQTAGYVHFRVLSERQRVWQFQIWDSCSNTKQLGHSEHGVLGRPAATVGAVNKLETQVDAVVTTKAGAFRLHDEHHNRSKYLIDVLLHFSSLNGPTS